MVVFITAEKAVAAYVRAVTAGCICFAVLMVGFAILSSGNRSLSDKISDALPFGLIVFVVSWLITFFTMFLPALGLMKIASRVKIYHWSYYVLSALLLSLPLILIFLSIPPLGINDLGFEPPLWKKFLRIAPFFCLSSVVAGLTGWNYLRKNSFAESSTTFASYVGKRGSVADLSGAK